jgi:tetratricopeptide (TPR) repeat protein
MNRRMMNREEVATQDWRTQMDRVATLKQVLEQNPNDTFARYGLAMEYSKSGETNAAIAEFRKIIAINPDYIAAYQQGAQTLMNAERYDEARQLLHEGISCASRIGNQHAASEMQGMLDEIGE